MEKELILYVPGRSSGLIREKLDQSKNEKNGSDRQNWPIALEFTRQLFPENLKT
jgi:hypothetical protein